MTALENMQHIQSLFIEAKERAVQKNSTSELVDFLVAQSGEFTSVAFEGASMGLALTNYPDWVRFCRVYGNEHGSQIYVGLGWALCEENKDLKVLNTLSSQGRWKTIDGYGYYMGTFNRRETIRKQKVPPSFFGNDLRAFNQGVGRSLWYLSQANTERLLRMINLFDEDRKPDIWRGVGVALTYVGGISREDVELVIKAAERFIVHLRCGAYFALVGRSFANCPTVDSTMIGGLLKVNSAHLLTMVAEEHVDYGAFIDSLEVTLSEG